MSTVSAVIPTYNDAKTLNRAIESVIKQTFCVDEIIVVDDASEDNTRKIVEDYDDDRIQLITHEENQGGSAARNTGIKNATGEYVAFLDADDEWHRQKIEKQLNELKSKSDEWVAVHCGRKDNWTLTNQLGHSLSKVVGTRKRDPPVEGGEKLIKEVLLINFDTGASTLMVERETVENIGGYDADFPRHQDWEFLIRILQQGKLAYVNEPLVTKHSTGRPDAEVHAEAKKLLLDRLDEEVTALEAEGYDVTHTQALHLTKLYFEDGAFRTGWRRLSLSELSPPEILSVLWSVALGLRQNFK